jgi:hypothetical protein
MAQEANTQTIRLRKTYRETEYGGFTKTYVLTPDGKIIKPVLSERSNSGRHGWDEWMLGNGRYVIVTINRPNIRNGPKPFEVRLQCVEYTPGESRILNSAGLYVMRVSMSDLKEWAKGICPPS